MNAREKFGVDKEASVEDTKKHWQKTALINHTDYGGNVADFMQQQALYKAAIKEALQADICPFCKGSKRMTIVEGFTSMTLTCTHCK